MAAVQAPAVDMDKLMAFLGQVIGELGATVNAGLIVVGDRLGLYKAMAAAGAVTPAELAEKTGTSERYVREWLNAQAAGGYGDIPGGADLVVTPRPLGPDDDPDFLLELDRRIREARDESLSPGA